MQPELLSRIKTAQQAARFILDDRFWAQQKWDGERLAVQRCGEQIQGWNKMGRATAVSSALKSALLSLSVRQFILDGEYDSENVYYCWDVLAVEDVDLQRYAYSERYSVLQPFSACPLLKVLPVWKTTDEKQWFIEDLRSRRAEGVVFKDSTAPYMPGRARQHFKLPFEKKATVRVRSVDPIMDRASIEMLDDGEWCEVSGIKIQNGMVRPGDYVEVRYSSASRRRRLQQPVFLRVRKDVANDDCTTDQLEFSGRWAQLGGKK